MQVINPCDCPLAVPTDQKRKKHNHELLAKANEPLIELMNTEHDHWHRSETDDGTVTLAHSADARWLEAVEEYNRRIAAYWACKPF